MILYHGTDARSAQNIKEKGIDLLKGGVNLDFGQGFYTTPDLQKARARARFKAHFNDKAAYIVEIEVDESALRKLNYKVFKETDIAWGNFIINNRCGIKIANVNIAYPDHNLDQKYDVIEGEIADGTVSTVAYNLRQNVVKFSMFDYRDLLTSNQKSYGKQISFHTEAALSCIKSIKCNNIDIYERK